MAPAVGLTPPTSHLRTPVEPNRRAADDDEAVVVVGYSVADQRQLRRLVVHARLRQVQKLGRNGKRSIGQPIDATSVDWLPANSLRTATALRLPALQHFNRFAEWAGES